MKSPADRRAGFTLLETLISLGLMSLLMAVVWSLLTMYARVEQQGSERALALQLVRSLHTQLRRDLQAIVTNPASPAANQSTSGLVAPALVGTTQSLQLLVREDSPLPELSVGASSVADPNTLNTLDPLTNASSLPSSPRATSSSTSSNVLSSDPFTASAETLAGDVLSLNSGQATDTGYQLVEYRFHPHPYLALVTGNSLMSSSAAGALDRSRSGATTLDAANNGLGGPGDSLADSSYASAAGTAASSVVSLSPTSQGLVRTANMWPSPGSASGAAPSTLNASNGGDAVTSSAADANAAAPDAGDPIATDPDAFVITETDASTSVGSSIAPVGATAVTAPPRQDAVPEITRCEFRYFDGTQWRESWQGTPQKPLPVAIEVALDLEARGRHQEMLAGQASMNSSLPPDPALNTTTLTASTRGQRASVTPSDAMTPMSRASDPSANELLGSSGSLDSSQWIPQYRFVIRLESTVPKAASSNANPADTTLSDQDSAESSATDADPLEAQESSR